VAISRAYAVKETCGLMKFVINADTDEILGAPLLRIDAREIITTVAVAVRRGVTAATLCDAIHTDPRPTEASTRCSSPSCGPTSRRSASRDPERIPRP
jgi:pyruvate/2-oxoglutarate dehydrogenase complex dihydrolipoamide dehydrogenase (E3) component